MKQAERKKLMERIFKLSAQYDQFIMEEPDSQEMLEQLSAEMAVLAQDYLALVPTRKLSRCPFTGEVFNIPIDDQGLDGLWWNNEHPIRPWSDLLSTFFALDGALKPQGPVEVFPFICAPGPDVPYVIPRILEYVQVKAVISSFKVGNHTAYAVTYFSDPPLDSVMRVNEWGANFYWESGTPFPEMLSPGQRIQLTPDPQEWDFDLAPWIKAGKVLWIAPEDEALVLRSTIYDCPYLNLPGSRKPKYLQNGKMWENGEGIFQDPLQATENSERGED
ncbi:hypothetical protein SAMN02745975_03786 [Geosporobacter subterraneus DSM 17957]|uniref:Uncharacterized protein n=1 Tax=Geosporobacter subterraneus DSM 17957 TaxID=1121919 RepID=A0A1M6Q8B9_9FIRM|nr:hypothetical protein [Geosporobacter subterraneus]SHK16441.1 hypothetical protein SAMN02745975_03786 [Geosporobacter subterraneus DSM 17957]